MFSHAGILREALDDLKKLDFTCCGMQHERVVANVDREPDLRILNDQCHEAVRDARPGCAHSDKGARAIQSTIEYLQAKNIMPREQAETLRARIDEIRERIVEMDTNIFMTLRTEPDLENPELRRGIAAMRTEHKGYVKEFEIMAETVRGVVETALEEEMGRSLEDYREVLC